MVSRFYTSGIATAESLNYNIGEIKGLGGYSEYVLADERISYPLPTDLSPEHASTVPLAAATAWLALYSKGCLAIDREQQKGTSVLIWGGSCKFQEKILAQCAPRRSPGLSIHYSQRRPLRDSVGLHVRIRSRHDMQPEALGLGALVWCAPCFRLQG